MTSRSGIRRFVPPPASGLLALSALMAVGWLPPAVAQEVPRQIGETLFSERTILGTGIHGHLFVDSLPINLDGAQIGSAIELRRARLSFDRQLRRRWEVRGSVELVSGSVELKDFYVRKRFDRLGMVTIGNHSEPYGLDELTSALALPFLEPSLPTAFVPGRNFGVAVGNRHGDWLYQVGVFGSGTEQEGRRDLGSAATGRVTRRTIDAGGDVRHFGLALSGRQFNGDAEQFRSVPEIGIDQQHLVDTGSIVDAQSTQRTGVEYLQTFGRWVVQAEAMRAQVRRDPGPDLRFGGAYVEFSWLAWGTRAQYDDGDALLARAPVTSSATWRDTRGRGNLALSARLSRIDLSDADISGGTETNLSLGATWDVSPRGRIAANLVRIVELSGPQSGADHSTALALRFQYAW